MNIFNFENPDELALNVAEKTGDLSLPPLFQNCDYIGEDAYKLTMRPDTGGGYNRKNYLLVMPRFITNVGEHYDFPLGILYVSSSFKAGGFHVYTLNLNHQEDNVEAVLRKEIEKNNIDVIATGGLTADYPMLAEVVQAAKRIKPDIITMVGGGFVTSDPETAMECIEEIDIGMIGEGEITICEIGKVLDADLGKVGLQTVEGIIFRDGEKLIHTRTRSDIQDLDALPWPDYVGFEFGKTLEHRPQNLSLQQGGYLRLAGSRSCPFHCTFCFHTSGQTYRVRSLDNIFEELDYWLSKYSLKGIMFVDELFAQDRERLFEFCRRIKDYHIEWNVSLRVSVVTEEVLQAMKDSGCTNISFGVESASNVVLSSMRKNITVQQIDNAFEIADRVGMKAFGMLIFGDTAETEETVHETLNWWLSHPKRNISLWMIIVFPGTYLFQYACEKGIIQDKVKFIKDGCPLINVSQLSNESYNALAKQIADGDVQNLYSNKTFIPNSSYEQVAENIKRLVDAGHKIALWGVSIAISEIFEKCSYLQGLDLEILDRDINKQGEIFFNHTVKSPELLSESGADCVILCPALFRQLDIKMRLKRNKWFKQEGSQYVVGLQELAKEDFDIEKYKF